MKKNFLQDVIPANQKRSIRDVPLPSHKDKPLLKKRKKSFEDLEKATEHTVSYEENYLNDRNTFTESANSHQNRDDSFDEKEEDYPERESVRSYKKTKSNFIKKITLTFLIILLVTLGFLLSKTKATITIVPKKTDSEVSSVIVLDESNTLPTKTQVTKTLSKKLLATAEKQVEKQSSGRIKITNKYKEVPQELVKNTRFQAPNGLIYRIRDSIVIPGYTMSGPNLVPGTLEVDVFADSVGEDYNTSKITFTIPGFLGKEQFEKITAESITDITGGYIGIQKVVSEEALEEAQKNLETELSTEIGKTQNQSTEYIIVPDVQTLTFGELQDKVEGDSVILSLSASVDAYSFVKKELFNFIGQNTITGVTNTDQFALDSEKLNFLVDEKTIKVSGSLPIEWVTNVEQLKKDFANKKKSEAVTIINSYKSFEKAEANLSPFWKTRFPVDVSKIDVVITQ